MKFIYGISGKKHHGKDTLAKAIQDKNYKFTIIHFAGELKRMAMMVFNLTHDQVWEEIAKETPFESPIVMDNFIQQMETVTGIAIEPQDKIARTPREILQFMGTDYVRKTCDSYWIDRLKEKIEKLGTHILIPDCRYPNEADFLKSLGGEVIKIVRLGLDEKDGHSSETSIDDIEPNWMLKIPEGKFEMIAEFADVVAKEQLPIFQQEARAKMQLQTLVEGFTNAFSLWEDYWQMGANVGIDYHSVVGKKIWKVLDVKKALYKQAEASTLASVADTMKEIIASGGYDRAMEQSEKMKNESAQSH